MNMSGPILPRGTDIRGVTRPAARAAGGDPPPPPHRYRPGDPVGPARMNAAGSWPTANLPAESQIGDIPFHAGYRAGCGWPDSSNLPPPDSAAIVGTTRAGARFPARSAGKAAGRTRVSPRDIRPGFRDHARPA